jgi:TonB-linked SusC/RagA family outer membrane protein
MKTVQILLLIGIFNSFSIEIFAQLTKVSLDLKDVRIEDVLNEIEKKSDYYFFFNQKLIDVNRRVDIKVDTMTIETVLSKLFYGADVNYILYDRQIILAPNEVVNSITAGQKQRISGIVTDATTGESLPGVNVIIEGTLTGEVTDQKGKYILQISDKNAVLLFSFIGYYTERVVYYGQRSVDIKLLSNLQKLEEVIVIGYGVQMKSVVTGAISSLKTKDFQNSSITYAEQALQGKASGVQVISNSGAPGAGSKIRIRGYSSNGVSDPLYIIDGVRATNVSNIDPNDISGIEVLKDAASAAIYGAEGANGVVLITTKNGSNKKEDISYDFQYGWQSLAKKPEVMNAEQFATYMTEAKYLSNPPTNINTNWIDEIFVSSPIQKHHLSFTGGSDKSSFFLSLSYLNQDGIVKGAGDKFERYTLMFNSDYKISPWLRVGHNISFAHTDLNSVSENSEYGSVISNSLMFDPLTPISYTGSIPTHVESLLEDGKKLMKDENGNYYGISEYMNGEIINPFVARDITKPNLQNDILFGNIYANTVPLKNVILTSKFGFNILGSNTHTYYPQYYYNPSKFNNLATVSDLNSAGRYWQWENYMTYNLSFGDNNFTVLGGMSSSENQNRILSASGGPLTRDQESYADLSYISSQASDQVSGTLGISRKVSYFGRVSYDFKSKYLFQGNIRHDAAGLDILPPGRRWGTFPSLSLGWVISNEGFFPKNSFVSYIKLRGSWGQNGSLSNLGNYQYASTLISTGIYPILEDTFYTATWPARLSNPDLTWETSEQTDLGLDLRLFNDRLTFTMDYFNKNTKDLISSNTPPLETGNAASPVNAGKVLNRGFEFNLGYNNVTRGITYSINSNFSTLFNEVTFLNPDITRLNGAVINRWTATAFEKGFPIWYFRGYKTNGINPTTGDPEFVDMDGKPGITEGDKTYIGSAIPKIVFGGNFYLGYRGFDLNLFIQGQAGNEIIMALIRTDRPINNRLTLFFNDRWTPDNIYAKMPKAGTDSRSFYSDLLVFDGSYLRIKQIQVGYKLPASFFHKFKLTSTRIYISLEDLYTFTKYPGMDTEGGSTNNNSLGIDRGMFPISRKLMFGVSVTL